MGGVLRRGVFSVGLISKALVNVVLLFPGYLAGGGVGTGTSERVRGVRSCFLAGVTVAGRGKGSSSLISLLI